ncbi:hypothetical protein ASG67_05910 [Sphingomonas sp. Leaf339]|nr:hypothetical protein ASG67_05910 [Sphingomonas sp. Leaf339]
MMPVILMLATAIVAPAAAPADASSPAAALADSVAGWNSGSLDRFMAAYADDAIYVTSKGVVRGKPTIAEHYAPSFTGGTNTRGKLTIEPLVERPIDARHRLLIGRWTLHGPQRQTGLTTLIFERRGSAWRIMSDHSS